MENIFEGAKFGDKFLTRDGRIAIYHRFSGNKHCLITNDDCPFQPWCDDTGKDFGYDKTKETKLDIVSRYQEPIDNNKLNELAEDMSKGFWSDDLESFEDNPQRNLIIWAAQRIYECGIKNGYKKAKSE